MNQLTRAENILNAMLQALDAERQAVAKLDSVAMGQAREAKEKCAAELAQLGQLDTGGDKKRAAALKALMTKVLHQSRANAALLADATRILSARLGYQRPSPGTYDRRARMYSHHASLMGGRL
ncbi:MAG TPA: hypothetical protein VHB97_09115 [Polyangia bacterium]|nr:hypothetical protein [Polyangia bacterium]